MPANPQEITYPLLLCDEQGRLRPEARGWSRHPYHECNLRGRPGRKKRWDYWCITGERFAFSATIADIDYAGLGGIYFLEYATHRFAEQTVPMFFGPRPAMPPGVGGDIRFEHKALRLRFESRGETIHMTAESKAIKGLPFTADLIITRPPEHETLNVVVPWSDRTFQFTSKQHCLPAQGRLCWGGETLDFDDGAFACLDYGRGIWPYRTAWNWASFSGRADGHAVGVNMGAKWTDGTGMNENGIVLDGRLYKIFDDLIFEYDPSDFMRPWRMRTPDAHMLDLIFTPFYDKKNYSNLFVIESGVHQCFGRYDGVLRVADQEVRINQVLGWAEEHRARW